MPSLSSDITFIDFPNVVSLVTEREHLKPDLTNGKNYIYVHLNSSPISNVYFHCMEITTFVMQPVCLLVDARSH